MEILAAMFGISVLTMALLVAVTALLYPLFWIWMLVDSIVRDTSRYPGGAENEKIVWVLLVALVQPVSVLYFFLVHRKVPQGVAHVPVACVPGQACS